MGGRALALGYAAFRFPYINISCYNIDAASRNNKLAKVYYSPQGYWRSIAAIKKLADAAIVPEETVKQWLIKQAVWQIYLPAPRYVPRPNFDVARLTRSTKRTFFFCLTTSSRADAKFSNTR